MPERDEGSLRVDLLSEATPMTHALLQYYEAIETASREMLEAARLGDWDRVV